MSRLKFIVLPLLCGLSINIKAIKPVAQYYDMINRLNAYSPMIHDSNRSAEDRLMDIQEAKAIIQELKEVALSPRIGPSLFRKVHFDTISINESHRNGIMKKLQAIQQKVEMQEQILEEQRQKEEEEVRTKLTDIIENMNKEHQALARRLLEIQRNRY